jgi:hypothetical protein
MGACCASESGPTAETVPEGKADPPASDPKPTSEPTTQAESAPPFKVTVEKAPEGPDSKVGLDVTHQDQKFLKIKTVKPGLVDKYNKTNKDTEVKVDDYIIAVNDVSGSSDKMLAEIKKSTTLVFTIQRGLPS